MMLCNAVLQLVQKLWRGPVAEAAVVDEEVRVEHREAVRDLGGLQVVEVMDVRQVEDVAADVVEVESFRRRLEQSGGGARQGSAPPRAAIPSTACLHLGSPNGEGREWAATANDIARWKLLVSALRRQRQSCSLRSIRSNASKFFWSVLGRACRYFCVV